MEPAGGVTGAAPQQSGLDLGKQLSTWSIMFHTAVAERMGLSTTDHKALALLLQAGTMTAGELADLTGLTTGAITGVIDRLERGGYVQRARDPHDRRKVVVQPTLDPHQEKLLEDVFRPLAAAMRQLVERYDEQELRLIQDYTERAIVVLKEQTARLRAENEALRQQAQAATPEG
jgi:DNA-binding MarR family transcriptional regulator